MNSDRSKNISCEAISDPSFSYREHFLIYFVFNFVEFHIKDIIPIEIFHFFRIIIFVVVIVVIDCIVVIKFRVFRVDSVVVIGVARLGFRLDISFG